MLDLAADNVGGVEMDINIRLAKAKKGNSTAFEKLINENTSSMYRVAQGILKTETDVSDAIQETIYKAYKGLPRLKNYCYFKTWLIKILINECNTILRYHKRIVPIAEVIQNDAVRDPHDKAEVMSTIKCLDEDLKLVTILFYYEDLSIKDIASIVNIPEGTVKSRLSRARKKLYSLLTGKEDV